jgi:hypothetical protein
VIEFPLPQAPGAAPAGVPPRDQPEGGAAAPDDPNARGPRTGPPGVTTPATPPAGTPSVPAIPQPQQPPTRPPQRPPDGPPQL